MSNAGMSKLSADEWDSLVEFYSEGHTYKDCGVRFGVSVSTVAAYFKKHQEIPRRKPLQASRFERAERAKGVHVKQQFLEREAAQSTPTEAKPPPIKKRKIIEVEDY